MPTDFMARIKRIRRAARRQGDVFHLSRKYSTDLRWFYAVSADRETLSASWDTLDDVEREYGIVS